MKPKVLTDIRSAFLSAVIDTTPHSPMILIEAAVSHRMKGFTAHECLLIPGSLVNFVGEVFKELVASTKIQGQIPMIGPQMDLSLPREST